MGTSEGRNLVRRARRSCSSGRASNRAVRLSRALTLASVASVFPWPFAFLGVTSAASSAAREPAETLIRGSFEALPSSTLSALGPVVRTTLFSSVDRAVDREVDRDRHENLEEDRFRKDAPNVFIVPRRFNQSRALMRRFTLPLTRTRRFRSSGESEVGFSRVRSSSKVRSIWPR